MKRFCGYVAGFVFFISGILKLMDPVGASLVMKEYFHFLHIGFMDFSAMTAEEIAEVQRLVNVAIEAKVPVTLEEMTVAEAKAQGAMGLFESKYGERVKVYTMGEFSKEICGGPHAENTGDLVNFKIQKEESSSAGVRRIKAVINK